MINRTHLTTTTDLSADYITEDQENINEFIDELMNDASIIEHTDITNRNIDVINNESIELTPDDFIYRLNSGELPNVTIVVIGNVTLENSNISNLPSKLTITGDLTINSCNNITNMPANLNVGNLYIEKCQSLTALANDIIIQYQLSITECHIKELPDNLELQSLEITDSNIELKDNITIHKNLALFSCPNVSQLPKFSDTTENITLMYCGNISLPSLTVKYNLTIEHCDIHTIPEGMVIGANFFLTSCPYITSLPNKILIAGDLKIDRCNALRSLPEYWFANIPQSLPFIDKKQHSITLINSSIPEIAIKKYYKQYLPGNIHIVQEQDFNIPITLKTNKKLENLIAFWLQIIAEENNINITNITIAEIKDLLLFLQKLINTRDFLNKSTRKKLATEVVYILQLLNKDDAMREDILAVINDAVASCEDRVLLRLADIIFLPLLKQAEHQSIVDATGTSLKILAKQKLYADEITQYAIDYAEEIYRRNSSLGRTEPIEEIEFILDFKVKLRDKFNLHFTNRSMNYSGISNLQSSDADTAYKIINARVTEDYFNNYLQNWEPWKKHQRRWTLKEYNSLNKYNYKVNIDEDSYCILTSVNKKEIIDPIIYNNEIYSYAGFCEWYINTGTNPLNSNELIDINNIFALK